MILLEGVPERQIAGRGIAICHQISRTIKPVLYAAMNLDPEEIVLMEIKILFTLQICPFSAPRLATMRPVPAARARNLKNAAAERTDQ